jgi:hypothetical protein
VDNENGECCELEEKEWGLIVWVKAASEQLSSFLSWIRFPSDIAPDLDTFTKY